MPKHPTILKGESLEEFNAMSENLRAEFHPVTELECTLLDRMIHHEWSMRRALRMQKYLAENGQDGNVQDAKRLSLMVRYHKTHERAFNETKRHLESMRKYKVKMDALAQREANASKTRQRQWEQILKKMPPLTNWVN